MNEPKFINETQRTFKLPSPNERSMNAIPKFIKKEFSQSYERGRKRRIGVKSEHPKFLIGLISFKKFRIQKFRFYTKNETPFAAI